ncbi:MAG: nitroreductase family protein [Peptococcaceae bacterium]|nr:MAG: nitroreductase family protein [Peptococcaceae bacterium]
MDIGAIIRGRRSIRKFADKEVPGELLKEILDNALWAPSGMNRQDWEVVVVRGEQKDKLVQLIASARQQVKPGLEAILPAKIVEFTMQFFKNLGGAPVVILVYVPKITVNQREGAGDLERFKAEHDRLTALLSAAALAQNILLLACARGLGTCWMTGPKYVEAEINEMLGVKEKELIAAVPLGYPAQEPPAPPRKGDKIRWVGFE